MYVHVLACRYGCACMCLRAGMGVRACAYMHVLACRYGYVGVVVVSQVSDRVKYCMVETWHFLVCGEGGVARVHVRQVQAGARVRAGAQVRVGQVQVGCEVWERASGQHTDMNAHAGRNTYTRTCMPESARKRLLPCKTSILQGGKKQRTCTCTREQQPDQITTHKPWQAVAQVQGLTYPSPPVVHMYTGACPMALYHTHQMHYRILAHLHPS